ncbi:uncharacterized protein LOC129948205 [Eupeodes corollae]|uniref:uncharacterized protein LOC129948205 n=1 Tax=Eupeodes corollae TaxID=290404 RepID=UPI00248F66ED|nr:uncharacterized protein LOC129948205 [Eupeodes corollae]
MKLFLCLVVLAFAAVNAETPEAEASKTVILVKSAPQPLKIKPTLAPYKPLPLKVVKPKAIIISGPPQPLRPKPTPAPYKQIIKVVPVPTPARKPVNIQKGGAWWG